MNSIIEIKIIWKIYGGREVKADTSGVGF